MNPAVERSGDAVPVVNTFNEWDPLEEVVVGIVEDAMVPPWDTIMPAVVHDRAVAAPTAAMIGRLWLAGTPRRSEGHAATLPLYGRRPDATPRAAGRGRP